MMHNTKVEAAVASHRGRAERRNNFPFLKKINIPVLIIVGDEDYFTPVTEMKNIAAEIKGSKFVIIENAGHMPNMEQPEVFNKVIADFYEQIY